MKILILEQDREPENGLFTQIGQSLGIEVDCIDPIDLSINLNTQVVYFNESILDMQAYAAVVVRTYRSFATIRLICEQFTHHGKPIFGLDPNHHSFAQDKVCDLLDLHQAGLSIPQTVVNQGATTLKAQQHLAKVNWGFGGHGVEKYNPANSYGFYDYHFQEFIEAKSDWRILLVNSTAAPVLIERFAAEDDFRTNKHQGGEFIVHDTTHPLFPVLSAVAQQAGQVLHRWCAGVDIRVDEHHQPYILEVNRTPRLRLGGYEATLIEIYLQSWKKLIEEQV